MKTVLISTTSLWNCGDDFIRDGVLHLLGLRNDVRTLWYNRGYGISRRYANDFKLNLSLSDYVIIAGTPKWVFKNEPLYRHCLNHRIPMALIGVGTRDIYSSRQERLLKKVAASGLCEVALARDHLAKEALQEFGFHNAQMILDPCFFRPPIPDSEKHMHILSWRLPFSFDGDPDLPRMYPGFVIKALFRKIVTQTPNWKELRNKTNAYLVKVFESLPEPKIVTVHDNREILPAEKLFGKKYVYYSTDYNDLYGKYAQAKSFIGMRIHGAIPSLIHGTPVHLLYTNTKSHILKDAAEILGQHDPTLKNLIQVTTLQDSDDWESRHNSTEPPAANIQAAIAAEKLRTKKLLKPAAHLQNLMKTI